MENRLYFNMGELCKALNQYQEIIIYGTGNYAIAIYPQLIKSGLHEKIVCFTQTKETDVTELHGIPVIGLNKLCYDKAKCAVLIAVSDLYWDEIEENLIKYGYNNKIFLDDYKIRIEEVFCNLTSFKEYCEYIADWYIQTQSDDIDRMTVVQKLLSRGERDNKIVDSNLIVIISGHLSPRTTKIIGALKRKNYNIIVLSYCRNNGKSWCVNELRKSNAQILECRCIEEMLYHALQYSPLIYFFEPRWGDCLWTEIILKMKEYFGKVIFAPYDVLNDGYSGRTERSLTAEKYAFEHADGIVWRWFSKEYLETKGFRYRGKSIQFLDCCNHECMEDTILRGSSASAIRLCSVSGDGDLYVDDRTYTKRYIDWARVGEILDKIGNREEYIFHFYAGTLTSKNVERCKQYKKKYSNFEFFVGVEHNELLRRLKDYDYGCELYIEGEEPPVDLSFGMYFGSYYNNSVRNVFFDFLSAGLPIITTQASKLWEYLSVYDIVINMNLSNIDADYLIKHKEYYKARVESTRKELDIDNQISKLIQFFEEV